MLLIVFFAYFYTSMVFNPEETADNLRKQGGFIPGVRPGTATVTYIKNVLHRVTLPGASSSPPSRWCRRSSSTSPAIRSSSVRRHFDPHHDRRGPRHHEQGGKPAEDAQLRRFLQVMGSAGLAASGTSRRCEAPRCLALPLQVLIAYRSTLPRTFTAIQAPRGFSLSLRTTCEFIMRPSGRIRSLWLSFC